MNRARSPFFFVTLFLLAGLGAAMVPWMEGRTYRSSLITDEQRSHFGQLGLLLIALIAIPLVAILVLEGLIRLGWEPKWLRVRYLGVMVLDKEPNPSNPDRGWLVVALPDKQMERFYADHEEFPLVEKHQLIVLEVVGQYVADLRRLKGEDAEAAEREAAKQLSQANVQRHASLLHPASVRFGTWLTVLLMPILGGGMIAAGVMTFFTGVARVSTGGRYNRHSYTVTGNQAYMQGIFGIVVGLVVLGFIIYRWRSGWDQSDFPRRYRRSWWW